MKLYFGIGFNMKLVYGFGGGGGEGKVFIKKGKVNFSRRHYYDIINGK